MPERGKIRLAISDIFEGKLTVEQFVDTFSKACEDMAKERLDELVKLYGNDEEKIFAVFKEEFKDIAEIKVLEI